MTISSPFDVLLPKISNALTLIDVGARWGALSAWASFGDKASLICFEPDADEARRLQEGSPPHVRYLPIALGASDGTLPLTVTQEPACSSVYPPVQKLFTDYPGLAIITPERRITVPARRLDRVLADEGVKVVDALKLDTQGSELDILRGAEKTLGSVELVDIEVEFNPLYDGQNLFCDVDRFLRDHGFVLWRLSDLAHYAPEKLPGCSSNVMLSVDPGGSQTVRLDGGQIYWAQAQYVRADLPRTGAPFLPKERAVRAAALAGAYGFWDLSVEVLRRGAEPKLAAEIAALVRQDDPLEAERDISAENDQLRKRIAQQERTILEQDKRMQQIEGSRSWQLTAPLRALKRMIS